MNVLKGNEFYDGDPAKLANYKPEDIRKINGLGMKSVSVIAKALESMGVIGNAEEWLGRWGHRRLFESQICPISY